MNSAFDDDSDIDVVLDDETITLHYEQDLDGLATVSTDRAGAPIGGQVHVTVSDFRLNLDPTGEDRMDHVCKWHIGNIWLARKRWRHDFPGNHLGQCCRRLAVNWVGVFGGLGGEFTITADDGVVDIATD